MKKSFLLPAILLCLISCTTNTGDRQQANPEKAVAVPDTAEMTNNFYDNTETLELPLSRLTVEGEIENPGTADLGSLPLRSVIVKEALPDGNGGDRFIGAYRYDGYSLFDILEKRILSKANSDEFRPIIDLYVEVETLSGEKAVFSWGEIYYPADLHKIIIATRVSRIVPSKTKELWPMPSTAKIVAAADLLTSRNLSDPVKITVKSIRKSWPVTQGMSPMYAPAIELYDSGTKLAEISPSGSGAVTYGTVFYGRGRGIHSTTPFTGLMLKEILASYYPLSEKNIQTGMFAMVGKDGYRCAVSYSELFNRNDQHEFLLVRSDENEDGGLFRIFPSADFFSDRSIKSLEKIELLPKE